MSLTGAGSVQVLAHPIFGLCEHASMRSALVVTLLALPSLAHGHILLMEPVSGATDAIGNPQKEPHCGALNSTRNPAKVTTFLPGQTITVKFKETVAHTGWTRISFQPNGRTFVIPPAGNGPPASYPNDATGTTDMATGTIVLMDRIPDTALNVETTVQVTLPNMECDNCTLQFMQIMTDGGPGSYNGDPDLYFNCADITLAANAPDAGVPMATNDASVGEGSGSGSGTNTGMISGGCSAGGGAGALALLGFAGLRRRRRN